MYLWVKCVQDFIHQFYATKQIYLVKDLFKNITAVLGEKKHASTTYAWYI